MRACVRVRVRACVRVFVRACVCVPSPEHMWPILDDDRVEVFLWNVQSGANSDGCATGDGGGDSGGGGSDQAEAGQHYFIIECNKEGRAIQSKVRVCVCV